MKLTFLAVAVAAVVTAALLLIAKPAISQLADQEMAVCADTGLMANIIMDLRQRGALPSELIDLVASDDPIYDAVVEIVMKAYEEPAWPAGEMRQNAITEFQASVELKCLNQYR